MLSAIVRFALRFKGVVISLAFALIGYGLYALAQAKYDVFPEFAPQQVEIQTEAPGLAPEQVESLVTQPIENAVNGVPGIESIRSDSIQGLSVITVNLHSGSDIYHHRQAVAERLTTLAGQFPQGVQTPVMSPVVSSTGDMMSIGLTSPKLSLMELRSIADWVLKPRLLSVPGVAKLGIFGGEVRQLQIQIRPDRLIQYDLSMEDVLSATRRATGIRGAGFIDTEKQRIVIQAEGQSLTPETLAKTALIHTVGGNSIVSVTLGDVARVIAAPQAPISAASVMGEPGIVLNIWAQNGANTLEATGRAEQALEELRPGLEAKGVVLRPDLFRAANFIEIAVDNIRSSLLIGALMVVVILFLFLLNFRTAAISCTAIPLSLLTAVALLEYLGFSLNTMTLGGLAIAIGEVVDDAVIDVENILRRLRENRHSPHPLPAFQVVLNASLEVRGAVVYATFAVVLVFVPILTLPGLAGRLFAPMGIAYILAVLASLFMALTVTPALCLLLLGRKDLPEREPLLQRWLKGGYRKILVRVEHHPTGIVFFVILVLGLGAAALPFLGGEFLPALREGHFIIHMTAVSGTSIQESLRLGRQVTESLLKIPSVRSVAQRVGRAAVDDVFGPQSSELEVDLKAAQDQDTESSEEEIRKALDGFSGTDFAINTFLTERIEETLSGYTAAVVINIFGDDLDLLDKKIQEVAEVLKDVPGATDLQIQSPPGTPQISIRLRKADLAYWGFDPVDVLEVIRTGYQGSPVGQVYEENRVSDVVVILDPRHRTGIQELRALPLRNPTGTYARLNQLADIQETVGRYVVLHEGARRVQTVTCNVTGRDIQSFMEDAKKQILSKVDFPAGTYPEFGGTAEAQSQSQRDLLVHASLAGLGVLLLLSIVMGHARNLLLVLLNLPFALVGGVLAVFLSGSSLSMGSLVGFVTLFGITLRNSIMMISHYEHMVSVEGIPWGPETALRGASERLVPILMTALVTGLGLLPLALGSGAPGREIEGPMAMVILGGLASSTLLNLLVLPTLALRYGRFGHSDPAKD